MASPERLAIDGHDSALGQFADLAYPSDEAGVELLQVQEAEDSAKGVAGTYAAQQFQEPVLLSLAELLDFNSVIGGADHGAKGDADDVQELMTLGQSILRSLRASKWRTRSPIPSSEAIPHLLSCRMALCLTQFLYLV